MDVNVVGPTVSQWLAMPLKPFLKLQTRSQFSKVMKSPFLYLSTWLMLGCGSLLGDNVSIPIEEFNLEEQRSLYKEAKAALDRRNTEKYLLLKDQLENYPLYPYLIYGEAMQRISRINPEEKDELIEQLSDTVLGEEFYKHWIDTQASRNRWQVYVDNFRSTTNAAEECRYLRAMYRIGRQEEALDLVPKLWIVGKSQPKECDRIFEVWIQSKRLTNLMAWERLTLAIEADSKILARYLLRFFPPNEQKLAKLYYDVHRNPSLVKNSSRFEDTQNGRQVLAHGLVRFARDKALDAQALWEKYQSRFTFDPLIKKRLDSDLAFWVAREGRLYKEINPDFSSSTIEKIVDTALAQTEWQLARDWIEVLPTEERQAYKWQYWYGRTAIELNLNTDQTTLRELAQERTYYGFLAANLLDLPISINAHEWEDEPLERVRHLKDPRIARIFELYELNLGYQAKREWLWLLPQLEEDARIWVAYEIGNVDSDPCDAIEAAFKADAHDLIETRFPILYVDQFSRHTQQTKIELAVLLALTRQESAFSPDAKSRVGARGLMQLMPSTARRTAQNIKVPRPTLDQLNWPTVNIQIGTYHLRELLDEFENHLVLALAAYNAGSHRVVKWIDGKSGMDTAAWIETIPFYETRNYVKNVLAFVQVYSHLLNEEAPVFAEHETNIP